MRNLLLFLACILFLTTTSSCNKIFCEGSTSEAPPVSPYQNPVWHPNGTLLGFNRQVLKSVVIDNSDCMKYYACTFYSDSSGFWLINKDGTNMRRVTTFQLYSPSWSPDGKWIAFDNGGVIYKMAFDGANFDTSHIITLTDNSYKSFFSTWNSNSDTIFYDSDKDTRTGTLFYAIWKMAADGSGQKRITDTAVSVTNGGDRQPVCTLDNQILYTEFPKGSQQMQIFTMDANGNNRKQITDWQENFGDVYQYTYFKNHLYFEKFDVWIAGTDGLDVHKVIEPSAAGFSIAKDGTIAYINYSGDVEAMIDKTHGTIWTSDINGNNKKPLTYNNY